MPNVRWVALAMLASVLFVAIVVSAQNAGPDARVVPRGRGWWCMDMQGATGVCERTREACEAAIATFPWGGLPPPCVRRPRAYCATYSAGSATSPPSPTYECRRDREGCEQELAHRRSLVRPPDAFTASSCGEMR